MEAFTDTVGLRTPCSGATVIDVLYRQVEFVFMVLALAAVLGATIG